MNIQEEEEDYGEDFTSKREATSANKDAKNNDKVNAMRSEDSFTQQSRRSKINERLPHCSQLLLFSSIAPFSTTREGQHIHFIPQMEHQEGTPLLQNINNLLSHLLYGRSKSDGLVVHPTPELLYVDGYPIVGKPAIGLLEVYHCVVFDPRKNLR